MAPNYYGGIEPTIGINLKLTCLTTVFTQLACWVARFYIRCGWYTPTLVLSCKHLMGTADIEGSIASGAHLW